MSWATVCGTYRFVVQRPVGNCCYEDEQNFAALQEAVHSIVPEDDK